MAAERKTNDDVESVAALLLKLVEIIPLAATAVEPKTMIKIKPDRELSRPPGVQACEAYVSLLAPTDHRHLGRLPSKIDGASRIGVGAPYDLV